MTFWLLSYSYWTKHFIRRGKCCLHFLLLADFKFQYASVFVIVEEFVRLSSWHESKDTALCENHLASDRAAYILHSLHRYSLNQRSNDARWRYCLHILSQTGWLYLQGQHAHKHIHANLCWCKSSERLKFTSLFLSKNPWIFCSICRECLTISSLNTHFFNVKLKIVCEKQLCHFELSAILILFIPTIQSNDLQGVVSLFNSYIISIYCLSLLYQCDFDFALHINTWGRYESAI